MDFFLKISKIAKKENRTNCELNECLTIVIITAFLMKSEVVFKDYRLNLISNLCKDNLLSRGAI